MRMLLTVMPRSSRTRRRVSRSGASLIEMALFLPFLLFLVFAALTTGLVLDRHLSALQLTRYAGSMYARGTDFNFTSNRNLLLMGASGLGITLNAGNGVIYLSSVVKASPGTANQNLLVISERFVIGNDSLSASRIGTPSPAIWPDSTAPLPNGLVHDFENQPSALATLPAAFQDINLNERVYVVEVFYSLAGIGGWTSLLSGSQIMYSRAFF